MLRRHDTLGRMPRQTILHWFIYHILITANCCLHFSRRLVSCPWRIPCGHGNVLTAWGDGDGGPLRTEFENFVLVIISQNLDVTGISNPSSRRPRTTYPIRPVPWLSSRQGISNKCIDLVLLEYVGLITRMVINSSCQWCRNASIVYLWKTELQTGIYVKLESSCPLRIPHEPYSLEVLGCEPICMDNSQIACFGDILAGTLLFTLIENCPIGRSQ